MPWHLSKSDPRKVYDSHHDVVCVCMTALQAAGIVLAVNTCTRLDGDDGFASGGEVKIEKPYVLGESCTGQSVPRPSLADIKNSQEPAVDATFAVVRR